MQTELERDQSRRFVNKQLDRLKDQKITDLPAVRKLVEYVDFETEIEIEALKAGQRLGLAHSDICVSGLEFIGSCKRCDKDHGNYIR